MKKTTKFISAFMAAILCFNLVSFSAFAAEPSATETSFSAADLATYNQELADFGLNDDEIQQLQNITTKIANATTMREVDALNPPCQIKQHSRVFAAGKADKDLPIVPHIPFHDSRLRNSNFSIEAPPLHDFQILPGVLHT